VGSRPRPGGRRLPSLPDGAHRSAVRGARGGARPRLPLLRRGRHGPRAARRLARRLLRRRDPVPPRLGRPRLGHALRLMTELRTQDPPFFDLLNRFVAELRSAGLPVSIAETLDAFAALQHVGMSQREPFKAALGTTLVKNQSHYKAFEAVFEVFFASL